MSGQNGATNPGSDSGGAGGAALPLSSGGGAGNPSGAGSGLSGWGPDAGTGGVLFLVVGGTLTIGATGIISANGSRGGTGDCTYSLSTGGGASGGGSIWLMYGTAYANSGTVQANGGTSATRPGSNPGGEGGTGGAGSVTLMKIA